MNSLKPILDKAIKNTKDAILLMKFMTENDKKELLKDINVLMDSAQDVYLTYIKGTEKGIFDRTLTDAVNATEVAYGNLRICNPEDINKVFYGATDTYITANQQLQLKQLKEMANKFINEMERLGL